MALEVLLVPIWLLFLLALALIAAALYLVVSASRFLENAVFGLIALLIINFLGAAWGFRIGINILTILISAIFGLAGVGIIIILKLLGINL